MSDVDILIRKESVSEADGILAGLSYGASTAGPEMPLPVRKAICPHSNTAKTAPGSWRFIFTGTL